MNENRTLAKNSLILYTRLIITTLIGLYASRVVLLELGVENFGLYTIVGGLVAMFNMLSTTMISTSTRFIAVEIGKPENADINKIFNTLLVIHIIFSFLLILFTQTIGVWYVKLYLNISATQVNDAIFVLQLSTLSSVLGTLIIPFQGLVTAYERFNIKAFVEIFHSVLHLIVVLLLSLNYQNKLKVYSIYILVIQLIIVLVYFIYCKKYFFDVIKWRFNKINSDYKEVSTFFGWQLVYVLGVVGSTQGGALVMNTFFGTVINASYGISRKVNEIIFSFVKNLNQAAVPQIMKSYSSGNENRSLELIYKLSKYTFFIMLIPSLPVILSIDSILIWWLKEVPVYTAAFVVLRIIHGLISCLQSGFDSSIEATGKIRNTKLFFTIIFLTLLLVVYLLYSAGFQPYVITIVYIVGELFFLFFQIGVLTKLTNFKLSHYLKLTILPVLIVTILVIPQYFLRNLFSQSLIDTVLATIISIIITLFTIIYAGLSNIERKIIFMNIKKIYNVKIKGRTNSSLKF